MPVLGVIPFVKNLFLPDEDAVSVEINPIYETGSTHAVDIAVIGLPHIANSDDILPLRAEPGVRVRHVFGTRDLGNPQAIIIPGTKTTIADLAWMRRNGLAQAIIDFARRGGAVVGICGGFQMLGEIIQDPSHVESNEESAPGLGLLPVITRFLGEKATFQTRARIQGGEG